MKIGTAFPGFRMLKYHVFEIWINHIGLKMGKVNNKCTHSQQLYLGGLGDVV